MRILKKKERGYRSFSEKYDLSGSYAGKNGVPIGVLLLYILNESKDFALDDMTAEANGDIGEDRNILRVDASNASQAFGSLAALAEIFKNQELVIWELRGKYQDVDVAVTGRTYGTIICIRTPLQSRLNLMPWMSAAENATYNYHDYDKTVIHAMKIKFKLNQKVAIQTVIALQKEPDIWLEFEKGIRKSEFCFPKNNAVLVKGYTAEQLYRNYPLSELGAYNYLIYLRNDPEHAIDDLKRGLPRR